MLLNFPSYANTGEGMASPLSPLPRHPIDGFAALPHGNVRVGRFPCWAIPNGTQSRPPPVAVSRRSYWR